MCGIAGLVLDPPGRVDGALVDGFLARLGHRGPDGQGWLALTPGGVVRGTAVPADLEAEVVLCCRRLAIIDLSDAAGQPMQTPDGRRALAYNGEIYNYVELRGQLERLGHRFRSSSDTEVLLAAHTEWGPDALRRLVGMFAFAVLDARERSLFLARDFVGMKPLYHAEWQGGFAFASEIGPLLELPGVSRRPDPERLFRYLRFGLSDDGDRTLFADVSQLPSAHYAEIQLDRPDRVAPVRYWHPDSLERGDLSFDEAASELRERFVESVSLHLRSDAPLGAALSGGIDSSSIVMAARAVRGDQAELPTFSYLAGGRLDEWRWMEIVAEAARTRPRQLRLGAEDFADDLDAFLDVQQEPVVEAPAYAEYRLFKLVREAGVKVILTGEGSDELLGGYRIFRTARLASLVRGRRYLAAGRFLQSAARGRRRRVWAMVAYQGMLLPGPLREPVRALVAQPLMPPWLNGRWFAERGVRAAALAVPHGRSALREQLVQYFTEAKLPRLLRYGDRNSMAFSLEARFPFLTPGLAGFILSLPEEYVIAADGTSKAVLRRAMEGIVPRAVLERRDKIGFQPPLRPWMKALHGRVGRILDAADPAGLPAIPLERLRDDWRAWGSPGGGGDLQRLWRCVNVVRWADLQRVSFDDGP